jgi:hypothetical protein
MERKGIQSHRGSTICCTRYHDCALLNLRAFVCDRRCTVGAAAVSGGYLSDWECEEALELLDLRREGGEAARRVHCRERHVYNVLREGRR